MDPFFHNIFKITLNFIEFFRCFLKIAYGERDTIAIEMKHAKDIISWAYVYLYIYLDFVSFKKLYIGLHSTDFMH